MQVKGLGAAVSIWAAGRYAYALLADGTLWGWGEGYGGVLCNGKFDAVYKKSIKTMLSGPVASVYATQRAVFAWRPDGTLTGCGQHGFNVPNAPRRGHSVVPEPLLKWDASGRYSAAARSGTTSRCDLPHVFEVPSRQNTLRVEHMAVLIGKDVQTGESHG